MRVRVLDNDVVLWASASDTERWARAWPCSTLGGKRFVAVFDSNGLCDLSVNGRDDDGDIDGDEFRACCADLLHDSGKVPADCLLWDVLPAPDRM